ncbi:MAG: aldo/keto reductase [Betaproteobacteria bacterium HGW-Betaproteobacteria-7]|jgi:aryl-alcohol dehydrogenase-like predicted oxidoreductase|nr:MAG: aldo/keto reductase [Betaproteobacteria bacterium HGW-Betaproteobacteria-7]
MTPRVDPCRRRLLQAGVALGAAVLLPPAAAQTPLLTRPVPSTGIRLPLVGLGTNRFRFGDDAWLARLGETLAAFIRFGGQVVDTAPAYGDSEAVIGSLMAADALRERLFLATKVGREGAREGRKSLADSYVALRTPRLDLVQLHNLRGVSTVLPVLREQKAAGHIGHIGITSSSYRQYAEMEAIMRRERLDFIQVDYAVGNRGAGARLLPLAAERGMAVLVNLPFGRGAQFRAVGERPLPDWAAEIDCSSWAQVFLKYVVSHPAVTCAIPGSTQAAHVADNLGAARGRLPDTALRQEIARYFDAITDS